MTRTTPYGDPIEVLSNHIVLLWTFVGLLFFQTCSNCYGIQRYEVEEIVRQECRR